MWPRITALAALLAAGCLDPLVDDEYLDAGTDSLLLPPGTEVPSLHSFPELDEQVDGNDGVGRFVPLVSGFVAGEPVRYWDFGPSPDIVAPVWAFGTDDGSGGLAMLPDHPVLFDVVPGDSGYTPFWQVYVVFVTGAYAGELMTSPEAIAEAEARGLVQAPQAMPMYVNCPVVHPDVQLEVGGDAGPAEPTTCFYKGMRCYYFDIAPPLVTEQPIETYEVQNHYVLRRAGGEPLSEPRRNVDMTGDGDLTDTNDLFESAPAGPGYTPLVREVQVAIPADAGSIDTYQDETQADFDDDAQLFSGSGESIAPLPGVVVAYEVGETLINRPLQLEEVAE